MVYTASKPIMGSPDVTSVVAAGSLGAPGIGVLPSVTMETQLGEICEAWDSANGWSGKFIYLSIPASTTIAAGTLVQWDKNHLVTVVPAKGTSQKTGVAVAAAYNAIASSTSVQYSWFLIQGTGPVLKTAVAVPPQSAIYISTTAGRFYVTASAGGQVLGARSQNTATVSAAVSSVNVYFNFSDLEGA